MSFQMLSWVILPLVSLGFDIAYWEKEEVLHQTIENARKNSLLLLLALLLALVLEFMTEVEPSRERLDAETNLSLESLLSEPEIMENDGNNNNEFNGASSHINSYRTEMAWSIKKESLRQKSLRNGNPEKRSVAILHMKHWISTLNVNPIHFAPKDEMNSQEYISNVFLSLN